jgi:hypothetical protein
MLKTTLTIAGLTLASFIHLSTANAGNVSSYPHLSSNNLALSAHHQGGAVRVPATGWGEAGHPWGGPDDPGLPAHKGGNGTTKGGSDPSGGICCSSSSAGGDTKSPPPTPQLSVCCGHPGQPPLIPHIPPTIHGPGPGPYPDPRMHVAQ